MADKHQTKIIGVFERVSFPSFGMPRVKAKIDTGAYTGALHCTKIKEIEKDGKKILRFSPLDFPDKVVTTKNYRVSDVRSSNGTIEDRYYINTDIILDGETYKITLTLANRSEMNRPVLIGRRFLRKNHFMVDASKGRQYRNEIDLKG